MRAVSGQAADEAGRDESAFAADDVEAGGGLAAGLELEAEVVSPGEDGVSDPPAGSGRPWE
ncbi:hypothetical protein [Streptomyces sp. NPDC012756]|uniref:hypothetical protein n=1 Tax=Streptomyces sp. NPDC012756 TaxID=3364847 RepID=UPI00369CA91C